MSVLTRVRRAGPRKVGLALAGMLTAGLAATSALALSTTGASATTMTDMAQTMSASVSHGHTGFTNGWYDGHTVRFYYTKNFFCAAPPASKASSKCEGGTNYTQTPASNFDPLYVVVPLGFTPPTSTLQCPVAGRCIDHPGTIDLSAVLGKGTSDLALPPHSHIVATANGGQSEWWNVDVVGVSNIKAWDKIVWAKSDRELQWLQRHDSSQVTGDIPTNLFLYFSVLR
jgi:hypothetical protein